MQLEQLVARGERLTVLTGAGISAASGIPTYRDSAGKWLHSKPIQHQDFIASSSARQRYWARSISGWQNVGSATPNAAHIALATLEHAGVVELLVTQNVDRLHQRAGHSNVIDLHGRLDQASCLSCGDTVERRDLQSRLLQQNPNFASSANVNELRPDGDAEIDTTSISTFNVPACTKCGGILKPDVVFFGGSVPPERVAKANNAIKTSAALLVVGSSLAVFSGFRFCRNAAALGKPLFIINEGGTRADALATEKLSGDCAIHLQALVALASSQ